MSAGVWTKMLRVRPSSLTLGGVNHRRMVLEATRGYFHRNSTTRAPGWCTHSSPRRLSCLRVHLRCSIVQPGPSTKCNANDLWTFSVVRRERFRSIILPRRTQAGALNYDGSQLMPIIVVHAMAIWRTSKWQFA